jgi:hypothetical protein
MFSFRRSVSGAQIINTQDTYSSSWTFALPIRFRASNVMQSARYCHLSSPPFTTRIRRRLWIYRLSELRNDSSLV